MRKCLKVYVFLIRAYYVKMTLTVFLTKPRSMTFWGNCGEMEHFFQVNTFFANCYVNRNDHNIGKISEAMGERNLCKMLLQLQVITKGGKK